MLHAKAVSSVSSLATKGTYFEPNAKQVAGYSLGHLHGPSLKSTAKLPPTEKTEKSGSVFLTFELNLYKEKLRCNSHVVDTPLAGDLGMNQDRLAMVSKTRRCCLVGCKANSTDMRGTKVGKRLYVTDLVLGELFAIPTELSRNMCQV